MDTRVIQLLTRWKENRCPWCGRPKNGYGECQIHGQFTDRTYLDAIDNTNEVNFEEP
ncbi:MAG: hypothetical protein WC365_07485 [Candidatus Babeliales bacterium]|jgi:hypothetical protein